MIEVEVEHPSSFILETSYEVIHKVGGVETVVRSKAPELAKLYGSRYFMVGMFLPQDDRYFTNFEDKRTDFFDSFLLRFEQLFGLPERSVKFGNWLIPGEPRCFLLPIDYCSQLSNYAKKALFEDIGLGEPPVQTPESFKQNAVAFGAIQWAFYQFFLAEYAKYGENVVIQTHEWLAGVGLLLTKKRGNVFNCMSIPEQESLDIDRLKFVFTTHATTMGRHLSAGDADLNKCILCKDGAEWDREAQERNIIFEHRIERSCAGLSNVFTTVSTVTSLECEAFLGRKVDVITWNGLNVDSQKGLVDDHELNHMHELQKQQIMNFIKGHFFGIDVDNCYIFFSAGRYEYKNKGYDLFIDALYEVNKKLRNPEYIKNNEELKDKYVVGIIIAPFANNGFTEHSLYVSNLIKEIDESVDQIANGLTESLGNTMCEERGENFDELPLSSFCGNDDIVLMKRLHESIQKSANQSPVTTHKIIKEDCELLSRLRELNLLNNIDDKCKIVWVPEFLSKTSIFGIDYNDFVRGADLGVFCSLYEPFGYTSPESMTVGTASIVSNLCGFGNYIEDLMAKNPESSHSNSWIRGKYGVEVTDRVFKTYWDTVLELHDMMLDYLRLTKNQQIALRNKMARSSVVVDWSLQIKEYINAYNKACGYRTDE